MQFIDEAKIYLRSGNGGNGCIAFRREKFIQYGGPDGGNGGRGADVLLRCTSGINTLIDFRYQQHFKAPHGENGKGQNRNGMSGEIVIVSIPRGTQIFAEDGVTLIHDFKEIGEEFVIAKGGNGGFGNAYFKTSVNQAPKRANSGLEGQELWVWLKLKLLSDAGLVGLPNAGKSTFLSRVTAAKPKIADYPFTTLKPQLGVVRSEEHEFVLADIPGLIKGAHLGVGLGCRFLKHIERCRVILHLVDINSIDFVNDYNVIRNELSEYGIAEKEEIIALNKIDALSAEEAEAKKVEFESATGKKAYLLSGVSGFGVKNVINELFSKISQQVIEES